MGILLAKLWSFFGNEGTTFHQTSAIRDIVASSYKTILDVKAMLVEQHDMQFK